MTIYRYAALKTAGKLRDTPTFSYQMAASKKSKVSNLTSSVSEEQSELEFLRLQVQAYQILIEEAEKEFGISLHKSDNKPSTGLQPSDWESQ